MILISFHFRPVPLFVLLFLLSVPCLAQNDQQEEEDQAMSFSAHVDLYYLYDFNKPKDGYRPPWIYSYNRANEVNLNFGYIKASYATESIRGNLALMTGTYANANLAAEPGVLKNIYEANAGVKISSNRNLWIDAGIFTSHIGFESAHAPTCWTLTRSILADNSPYFETGAKISYTSSTAKWFLAALVLNGWQRIQQVEGNTLPSFGTQVTFTPSSNITINSSTFIGTDKPDSARLMRYFHDFYSIIQLSEKVGVTLGFDIGLEQKGPEEKSYNTWYSPIMILRVVLTDKLSLAGRVEYYADKYGVIVPVEAAKGFKTTGISLNLDYRINKNALWRIEARNFTSREAIFQRREKAVEDNTFITSSLAVTF